MNHFADGIKLPRYHHCFVCGDQNPIGLDVTFTVRNNRIETTFTPEPHHGGYQNIVHGGILATLLDECMGWSGIFSRPILSYTAELNVRYKESAYVGENLLIYGELVKDRKRIVMAQGAIEKADGTVVCTGEGKYMPMAVDQQAEVVKYAGWNKDWEQVAQLMQSGGHYNE